MRILNFEGRVGTVAALSLTLLAAFSLGERPIYAQSSVDNSSASYRLNEISPTDTSGLGAKAYVSGVAGAENLSQNLGFRMARVRGLENGYSQIQLQAIAKAQADSVDAALNGTSVPSTAFAPLSPKQIVGTTTSASERATQIETVSRLLTLYDASTTDDRVPRDNFASSCGYFVSAMYWAGTGTATTSEQREAFRATCVLGLAKSVPTSGVMSAQRRTHVATLLELEGSILIAGVNSKDPAVRAKSETQARSLFKATTGRDMAQLGPDDYVCVIGNQGTENCPGQKEKLTPQFPRLLAKAMGE